jgi:twinkle protein
MKITNKQTGEQINVDLRKFRGEEQILCPACSHTRKKKTDKCLSWNHDKQTGMCFNCGAVFYIQKVKIEEKKYIRPEWQNNTDLSDKAVKYFENRGISQFTLRQMKITTGFDWMPQFNKEVDTIHFNYFRNDELINIKYRGPQKSFKIYKDAELIFYNIDSIKDSKEAVIVEGEIDALSYFEVGIRNVLSVPNGAKNFQFLDNCFDELERIEKVYIAVDTDEPGMLLRDELIRRIGAERCLLIDFKGKKDANEYLVSFGKEELGRTISEAKEIPMDGIIFLAQTWDSMINTFRNGKKFGTTTYFKEFDKHWKWRGGDVNIWTGYNNEGKSCFLANLCINKAKAENWKFAVFSPENYPVGEYYDELIHCYVGKSTDKRYNNVMTEKEYNEAASYIHEHFYAIIPDENYHLETILSKMRWLIRKYGVNSCIIDPYNQIEHLMERGEREDLYISRFMSTLKRFAVDNDISMHLVAHQVTPMFSGKENYPQPDTYKIKGGGTFSDKSDNVIAVWRPFRKSNPSDNTVRIIIGKIKKQRLVGIPGEIDMYYSVSKNQYFETADEIPIKFNEPIIEEIININRTIETNKEFDYMPTNEIEPF